MQRNKRVEKLCRQNNDKCENCFESFTSKCHPFQNNNKKKKKKQENFHPQTYFLIEN